MSLSLYMAVAGVTCYSLAFSVDAASAQQTTSTTEARTFEVVAVNGNALVVKEASGTQGIHRSRHVSLHDRWKNSVGSPPPAPAPTLRAAAAATSPPTATPAASTPTTPATVPETRNESSSGLMWGIVGLAAVIVIVFLISRKGGSSI